VLNKLKFGVFLPFYAFEAEEGKPLSSFDRVRDVVLECERLGYHRSRIMESHQIELRTTNFAAE